MARTPTIDTARSLDLRSLQVLANQTRERLGKLDDAVDQATLLARNAGAGAITALQQQVASLTTVQAQMQSSVAALSAATAASASPYPMAFDGESHEDAFFGL